MKKINFKSPNFSQVEIDERYEKRRKERVHKSSRESTTLILDNLVKEKEEFMKKSIQETKKSTIVDMKIIPEEKEKRRKSNRGKGIKTTVVKEENLIKINKSTEIKEKLQSQHDLYEEKPLLAAFDEDIMEVTEEDTDMSNSSKHSLKASKNSLLFLSLKPEFVKTKSILL